jgi:hypothetical protein
VTHLRGRFFATTLLVSLPFVRTAGVSAQVTPPPVERTLTSLRGNLYVARIDWRSTVVLVTPDGIVVGDPISQDGATWLRGELAARFPAQRVRYVLHSHHHFDRSRGASVFDGAETIGHRLFNVELRDARESPLYGDVAHVKRTFDVRERLTLGGVTVEIVHTGPAHAPDMSALYFPSERVLFDADPPAVDMVPFTFQPYSTPHDVSRWLAVVSALDIDTIVTGSGRRIDAGAVRLLKPYLDDVIAAVMTGVADGRALGRLQSEVLLPAHAGNGHHAAREAHIEGVYRQLSLRQWSLHATGGMNRLSQTTSYCAGYDPCDALGGSRPAGTLGLGYSLGRLGLVAEFSSGDQLYGSRSRLLYDDIVANRRSTISGLVRYRLGSPSGSGVDVLSGFTRVISDTRGLDRIGGALTPVGGRHAITERTATVGYTVGADLVLSIHRRWSVRVPARFTSSDDYEFHPGRQDIHVGVGLSYRIAHRVVVKSGESQPVVMRTQP